MEGCAERSQFTELQFIKNNADDKKEALPGCQEFASFWFLNLQNETDLGPPLLKTNEATNPFL